MISDRLFTIREEGDAVAILDQSLLPHQVATRHLNTLADAAHAIRAMLVRGAPLIGVTAAYGVALALKDGAGDKALRQSCDTLAATRPTAVNLHWALTRMQRCLLAVPVAQRRAAAWTEARAIAAEDAAANRRIGAHGLVLIENIARRPASLMTHCNAGWLATAAWGTALAPMYCAREAGLPLHVYVSETRPRNQGLLTAWELHEARIPHTLIADNAAGLLLREGKVDMVIVGADRIAANGDTANKVGTYLKALAAADCGVPFYVAAPLSTIDRDCPDGAHIPIEARDGGELRHVGGLDRKGKPATVAIAPDSLAVANPAFDVTPARLISGIVTERGVCAPGQLHTLFGNGP
ncbi:MAG: S-methyl-5-thioribose-1-phosphate isomerase [Rhodocyclaceae bacterium]|jgi:methylthioribose-1-phosphate isomerase|nr:S-methyl-5-thioribose-1-phosphate isomerase [Rhodocyclaceae bacterium]MCC6878658.1 S-methyl-5-thioribose-1-phosphate isomerase [Rhodocyclaceae bacterium]MCL4680967.1 S-methyl-5-thioribose-1-phosphate isomerase [Rhodocyclaceae bacterium]